MKRRLEAKVSKVNDLSFADFTDLHVPSELLTYTTRSQDGKTIFSITLKNTKTSERNSAGSDAADEISNEEFEACFNLIETTSRADYEASSLGWRPAAKRVEMREEHMRYLLVHRKGLSRESESDETSGLRSTTDECEKGDKAVIKSSDKVMGFVSFMVTIEEAQPVVYLYEIHLATALRGLGLGRHLFEIVEHIASTSGMEKVMLTVFRCNKDARRMYEKLGYVVDDCSPPARFLRGGVKKEADYLILSKCMLQTGVADETSQRKRRRQEAE